MAFCCSTYTERAACGHSDWHTLNASTVWICWQAGDYMDGFLTLDGCLMTGYLASFGSVGGMEDWLRSEASSHLEVSGLY